MLTFEEFLIEQDLNVDDARAILNLRVGFSQDELKVAYKKFAKIHHPDFGGNTEMMKKVNAAYSKLKTLSSDIYVAPSVTTAEMTASTNSIEQEYIRAREARRAELLKNQNVQKPKSQYSKQESDEDFVKRRNARREELLAKQRR